MASGIFQAVGKAHLRATTGFAGASPDVLAYPSVDRVRPPNEAYIFPATFEQGETCWIPAASGDEAKRVLDNVVVDQALVAQRLAVPVVFEAVSDLAFARDNYLTRIEVVRQNWEAGGKILNEPIARGISEARDALRAEIRSRHKVSGFVAKAYDSYRFKTFSQTRIAEVKQAKVAELLRKGQIQTVIDKATQQTDDLANKVGAFAKTSLPVAKALSVGGNVAVAIEIPYRVYQLDIAKTDEQKSEALAKLASATTAGSFAAACLLLGVGTGGVGFLACGVAPVVTGIFAGQAAKWVYANTR